MRSGASTISLVSSILKSEIVRRSCTGDFVPEKVRLVRAARPGRRGFVAHPRQAWPATTASDKPANACRTRLKKLDAWPRKLGMTAAASTAAFKNNGDACGRGNGHTQRCSRACVCVIRLPVGV